MVGFARQGLKREKKEGLLTKRETLTIIYGEKLRQVARIVCARPSMHPPPAHPPNQQPRDRRSLLTYPTYVLTNPINPPTQPHSRRSDIIEKKAVLDLKSKSVIAMTDYIQIYHLRKFGMPSLAKERMSKLLASITKLHDKAKADNQKDEVKMNSLSTGAITIAAAAVSRAISSHSARQLTHPFTHPPTRVRPLSFPVFPAGLPYWTVLSHGAAHLISDVLADPLVHHSQDPRTSLQYCGWCVLFNPCLALFNPHLIPI